MRGFEKLLLAAAIASIPAPAWSQDAATMALLDTQREKIRAFDWAEGIWRGEATFWSPQGPVKMIQVERVGPFLDGSVKIVEGRGYDLKTGKSVFNALGVIQWHPELQAFRFHTFAQGRNGVYPVELKSDGYDWWMTAGGATIRYETRLVEGLWHEIGYRSVAGGQPVKFFEMKLKRVRAADWPKPLAMNP